MVLVTFKKGKTILKQFCLESISNDSARAYSIVSWDISKPILFSYMNNVYEAINPKSRYPLQPERAVNVTYSFFFYPSLSRNTRPLGTK